MYRHFGGAIVNLDNYIGDNIVIGLNCAFSTLKSLIHHICPNAVVVGILGKSFHCNVHKVILTASFIQIQDINKKEIAILPGRQAQFYNMCGNSVHCENIICN